VLAFATLQALYFALAARDSFSWLAWFRPGAAQAFFESLIVLVLPGVVFVLQHIRVSELRVRAQQLRSTLDRSST
jgi:hypothetical protein